MNKSAKHSKSSLPVALVLLQRQRGVAERIAGQLKDEGFEPRFLEGLPSLTDPQRVARLRDVLSEPAAPGSVLHPGVDIWAERPEIATIGQERGYIVLAPPVRSLTLFANKLGLLVEGERLGIPNLLLSSDPVHTLREIELLGGKSGRLRFPLVLRALNGGGSTGVRAFHDLRELERMLPIWMEQLRTRYGEAMLFAERYLDGARCMALPFARFQDGRIEFFPLIDASLQSRRRKIVEFCPALALEAGMEKTLQGWTSQLAEAAGFVGVGTLEFLVDGKRAFLIDGAARLTTSFHLWEKVAGTSAVAWQIATLLNNPSLKNPTGHPVRRPGRKWNFAVCMRLNAEDSLLHLPQPGVVRELSPRRDWDFPSAAAELQLDVEAGDEMTSDDSSQMGMLWVGGLDRRSSLTVARGVLDEVWIAGSLQTNERFLSELIAHPWVKEGIFHAGFVEEEFLPAVRPPLELVQSFAAVVAAHPHFMAESEPPPKTRWQVGDQWLPVEIPPVQWAADPSFWEQGGMPGVSGFVALRDGRKFRVCVFPVRENRWQIRLGNWCCSVRRVVMPSVSPSATGIPTKKAATPRMLALVSGRVHSLLYRAGSVVKAHEDLLLVETMGMLVPHAMPVTVRIREWKVGAEDPVRAGDELANFEVISPEN